MTVIGLCASSLPRSTRENTTSAFRSVLHRSVALRCRFHAFALGELFAERARHDVTVAHLLTYVIGESRKREDRVDEQKLSLLPRKVRGAGDYDGNLAA